MATRRGRTSVMMALAAAAALLAGTVAPAGAATTGTEPAPGGAAAACDATWRPSTAPLPSGFVAEDLLAVRANQVYASGDRRGRASVARWNGSRWSAQDVPEVSFVAGLAAAPGGPVYVVGPDAKFVDTVWVADGAGWRQVPVPPSIMDPELGFSNGIAANADGLWMLVTTFGDTVTSSKVARYSGGAWSIVPGEINGSDYSVTLDIAAGPAGKVWLVGEDIIDAGGDFTRLGYAATIRGGRLVRHDVRKPAGAESTFFSTLAIGADGEPVLGGWAGEEFAEDTATFVVRRVDGRWVRLPVPDPDGKPPFFAADHLAGIGNAVWAASSQQYGNAPSQLLTVLPRVSPPVARTGPDSRSVTSLAGVPDGHGWMLTAGSGPRSRLWTVCGRPAGSGS